jgi:hypothetical protein
MRGFTEMQKDGMALTELIYLSTMIGDAEHELKPIWESSVKHNQLNGITGMLLYHQGGFMQALEGSRANVMETYERICEDKRHHHIDTLTIGEIENRHFGTWSMGFKHINAIEAAKFPKQAAVFDFSKQADAIKAEPGLALEMLTLFSNRMVHWLKAPTG